MAQPLLQSHIYFITFCDMQSVLNIAIDIQLLIIKYGKMKKTKITLLLVLVSFIYLSYGQSSGWKNWRGPSADGSTNETDWSPEKLINGNGILWTTNVGTGHSSVAVVGDKLYTNGNWEISENKFIDRVVCLDVNSGEIIWQFEYSMVEGEDPGPFSTPVLDEGYVYCLSRGGQLYCFDADNGSIIWTKNLVDKGLTQKDGEFACSPVFVDDLLILNMNTSGLALNKKTGEKVWNSEVSARSLSSVVAFDIGDKNYISTQGDGNTYAVDPVNGNVKWMIPEGAISDPIFHKDELLIYSYKGSSLYNLKTDPPTRIWNNTKIKAQFQSYVRKDGYSYGFSNYSGMKLICFKVSTGEIQWEQKMSAGSLIISNDILIVIDKEGILRFIKASPENFDEIGNAAVIKNADTDAKGRGYRRISGCWTNPVLYNKKVYVRNSYGELVCLDVS